MPWIIPTIDVIVTSPSITATYFPVHIPINGITNPSPITLPPWPSSTTQWWVNTGINPSWPLSLSQWRLLYEQSWDENVCWQPAAPIVRQSAADLLARDQELFRRAVAEHDQQEAERLNRIIRQREQEIAARRTTEEELRRIEQEARAQRQASIERATGLLLEHLTPQQRETYYKNGWFMVEGGQSKTRYRINAKSSAGNIEVLESRRNVDEVTSRLCCHIPYKKELPLHDHLLAQKIMLELAEDDFLRTANRTVIR